MQAEGGTHSTIHPSSSAPKDVIANTDNSVDILKHRSDETYLCPAVTSYVTPLRAVNVEGKWRVIVNGVKAHYETLSQGRGRKPFR